MLGLLLLASALFKTIWRVQLDEGDFVDSARFKKQEPSLTKTIAITTKLKK
jgi:hypothetical protein